MSFNYGNMMKQAKIMQKKMEEIQEELKEMKFEASSGGGVVKVIANGNQEILEVKINKEMVDMDDLDMLEDMIMVASNDAIKQSKEESKNRIAGLTGGLNIPGF
ncbi:MAG: YbaB/EbfC family nucleoid-associated protein [Actinobacteria bacterium]|nr:YbaB/EbfC family nucleoid-associated protein [Actinomycetota bacterium]MBL7060830.1 YbaB/EbfC family nucleoid-associated protein [Actinomycetota bacterium]